MARGSVLGSIKERNKTLVTSGIYERYLEVDGKKYHHLFDPKRVIRSTMISQVSRS